MLNAFKNLYKNNFTLDKKENPFLPKSESKTNDSNTNTSIKKNKEAQINIYSELYNKNKSRYLPYQRIITYLSENPQIEINDEQSQESLIYGINAKLALNAGKKINVIIISSTILENEIKIIKKFSGKEEIIDINVLFDISFGNKRGNFVKNKISCSSKITNFQNNKCVSLFKSKGESWDLFFNNEKELQFFLRGILFLMENSFKEKGRFDIINKPIRKLWKIYDTDNNNKLELNEYVNLIKQLNFDLNKKKGLINDMFNSIDIDKNGTIEYSEFLELYKKINNGKEFEKLFLKYSDNLDYMYYTGFLKFLKEEQKNEDITKDEICEIILKYKINIADFDRINEGHKLKILKNPDSIDELYKEYFLTLEEFNSFLIDKNINSIINQKELDKMDDMNHPLGDYFIFSSHNTYLTKHQLYGKSSVEMYNYAVLNGCRLVELDCWDGEKEPIITHGNTITSKISFREVLENLRQNAFINSKYPLLLSIEMHCSFPQQKIIANLFKEILKDIYIINEKELPLNFPSPNKLQHKFIIKEGKHLSILKKEVFEFIKPNLFNKRIKSDEPIKKLKYLSEENSKFLKKEEKENKNFNNNDTDSNKKFFNNNNIIIENDDSSYLVDSSNSISSDATLICDKNDHMLFYDENLFSYFDKDSDCDKKENNFSSKKFPQDEIQDDEENNYNNLPIFKHLKSESKKSKSSDLIINIAYNNIDLKIKKVNLNNQEQKNKTENLKKNESFNSKEENLNPYKHIKLRVIKEIQDLIGLIKRKVKISDLNKVEYYKNYNFTDKENTIRKKSIISNEKKAITNYTQSPKTNNKKNNINDIVNTISPLVNSINLININQENNNLKKKIENKQIYLYFPWDCTSMKENAIEEIHKDFQKRKKLVEFCNNTFLKVYPGINRLSSDNFDTVKAWICGVQIAAMNIQSTEDDQMLINNIFFQKNKKCGLVLKPKFLRNSNYSRKYLKPLYKLEIEIISCLYLFSCRDIILNKSNLSIHFETYIKGCYEDDKLNTVFKSNFYEKNFVNCIFNEKVIVFDIYEPDLSFWIFKVFVAGICVARSCVPFHLIKKGIRSVPLFDKYLNEYEDCVALVKVNKKVLDN